MRRRALALRRANRSSTHLASQTVQVTSDAKARPIITAFTTMSALMNMPHGDRSCGSSAALTSGRLGGATAGAGAATVGAAGAADGVAGAAVGVAAAVGATAGAVTLGVAAGVTTVGAAGVAGAVTAGVDGAA